jgi:hypothetical protein
VEKVTDAASGRDNLTKGDADTRETEASNEGGDRRAELDEETLSVGAGNFKDILNLRSQVSEESRLALQVLAKGAHDHTNGDTNARETETRNENSNFGRKLDEEGTSVGANDSEESLDVRAEILDEVTDRGCGGDDRADRDADAGQADASKEQSNLRGELDEQLLCIRAGHGEDLVDSGSKVLDKVSSRTG